MNNAHWHLLLNHLPVVGTYFSVLILAFGLILKNQTIQNTALGLFILTALTAIPAFLTGEGAKDILESIGQKNEYFIHEHMEIAKIAFWVCEIIGALALAALIGIKKQIKITKIIITIVLLAGIGNSILLADAANTGGKIRHTEIRSVNENSDKVNE